MLNKSLGINPHSQTADNEEYLEEEFEIDLDEDEFGDFSDEEDYLDSCPKLNNIFSVVDNLNHDVVQSKSSARSRGKSLIQNRYRIPSSLREVSIAFCRENVNKILSLQKLEEVEDFNIASVDVSSELAKYGKRTPSFKVKEIERIVSTYSSTQCFDDNAVARFITLCKEGRINCVISYYIKRANARSKRNSFTTGIENIFFNFNVDIFRELCFGITTDDMSFDTSADETLLVIDNYVRVFWELYMLLVFYKLCKITPENEHSFFNLYNKKITLVLFTGLKPFMQLELSCKYGELYEELRGVIPFNPKYISVEDIPDKQQIHFYFNDSDFLTEAYRLDCNNGVYIPKEFNRPLKADKHTDIELCIKRGTTDNSAMVEVVISGQNPLGRIFCADTDPERVINFKNCYNYDFVTPNAIMFLLRTIFNYSKDEGRTSYYTAIQDYLNKKSKGKNTHGLAPKLLSVILPIMYDNPNEDKLKTILDEYFKPTDKALKSEYRKLHKEFTRILKPKKERVLDMFKREINYVW